MLSKMTIYSLLILLFPNFQPVSCSMSNSNHWLLDLHTDFLRRVGVQNSHAFKNAQHSWIFRIAADTRPGRDSCCVSPISRS